MTSDPETDSERETADTIGRSAERKLRARRQGERSAWFGLGMFGLVGWAVALPTMLGIAIGLWLDGVAPVAFSWTLALLLGGVTLGCLNAWFWISRESRDD